MAPEVDREKLAARHAALPPERKSPAQLDELLTASARAIAAEHLEDAEQLLEAALVVEPRRAGTWALLGHVEVELGDVTGAKAAYRRALELARDDFASALRLGQVHASLAEWEPALALAQWVLLNADDGQLTERAQALADAVQHRQQGGAR